MPTKTLAPNNAVLKVGDGRGFVVERRFGLGAERIIITAAHCLPRLEPPYEHLLALPTPHPGRYLEEATYQNLIGPLGAESTVWCECLFVDPIADIAVLGQPDNQALGDEADAYDALLADMIALPIAEAPTQGVKPGTLTLGGVTHTLEDPEPGEAPARVLSLDGQWIEGRVLRWGGRLEFLPHEAFVYGMSGSPIINALGAAIGVVSVHIWSPVLVDSLSTQLMRTIL